MPSDSFQPIELERFPQGPFYPPAVLRLQELFDHQGHWRREAFDATAESCSGMRGSLMIKENDSTVMCRASLQHGTILILLPWAMGIMSERSVRVGRVHAINHIPQHVINGVVDRFVDRFDALYHPTWEKLQAERRAA